MTDRFNGLVYVVTGRDLFLTLDYRATPREGDWVAIDRGAGVISIERYGYQPYRGVVVVLEVYQLQHSEQWTPTQNAKGLESA
jgi:hypothetical protein